MCDENIRTTLRSYVTDKSKWFFWYHNLKRLEQIRNFKSKEEGDVLKEDKFLKNYQEKNGDPIKVLVGFFDSTLDEARLKKANDFSNYALYISDKQSFVYFRRAESKREMSGEIDFDKQRDHAVHTLYNYLLGWYIFDHLPAFREAFRGIFKDSFKISLDANQNEENFYRTYHTSDNYLFQPHGLDENNFFVDLTLVNHFGDVWPMVSLLHDVGYILEGSLSPATPKIEHERVTNGTKVLHDYFNHWLWRFTDVDFRAAIDIAKSIGCVVPDFKTSKSMPALSDRLRDVGNLENVRNKAEKKEIDPLNPKDTGHYALNLEAFELWKLFYKKYINKNNIELILIEEDIKNDIELILIEQDIENNMELILYEVKKEYENDIWEGSILSKINLNHGVCGGLMLLQASTFWYELMWGLVSPTWSYEHYIDYIKDKREESERVSEKTFDKIKKEITEERIPAHIWLRGGFNYMDWVKDLWATAAVTIHDYVTKDTWNSKYDDDVPEKEKRKIDLQTDPLAYLEVLVDVLQEWDRYTVLGESAFSENVLLQSYETRLTVGNEVSSYISGSLEITDKEQHLDLIGIRAISDTKLRVFYPKHNPKRVGMKNYKKVLNKSLNKILKDWDHYVLIKDIEEK